MLIGRNACHTGLRWLRQAGAVILLIGFNFFNGEAAAGHTFGTISKPELEPTRLAENVNKIDLSKNVKGYFPVIKLSGPVGRNACDFVTELFNIEYVGGGCFKSTDRFYARWDEVRSQGKFLGLNFCPIRPFIGRRLTAIFERKIEPELRAKVVNALSFGSSTAR